MWRLKTVRWFFLVLLAGCTADDFLPTGEEVGPATHAEAFLSALGSDQSGVSSPAVDSMALRDLAYVQESYPLLLRRVMKAASPSFVRLRGDTAWVGYRVEHLFSEDEELQLVLTRDGGDWKVIGLGAPLDI